MNDAESYAFARWQAAFHEAGHAIVNWSFNIRTLWMAVNDDGDGKVQSDRPDHLPGLDQITILMAGWVGADESGYPYPSLDDLKLVDDFRRARKIAEDIAARMPGYVDTDDVNETIINDLLTKGSEKARKIIQTHQARFHQVAEELFSRGELRANEVATLLPGDEF